MTAIVRFLRRVRVRRTTTSQAKTSLGQIPQHSPDGALPAVPATSPTTRHCERPSSTRFEDPSVARLRLSHFLRPGWVAKNARSPCHLVLAGTGTLPLCQWPMTWRVGR